MSVEPQTPPDGGKKGPDGLPGDNNDKDLIPRGERDDAIARRDAALKRAQEAEDKLAKIERDRLEADATKTGDIEKLRTSFGEIETKLKEDVTKVTGKLRDYVIKADVMTILAEVSTDPDVAFILLKDEIEVVEDDKGNMSARPKNAMGSIKDFINKKLEQKPYLLKNDRVKGADGKPSSAKGGSGITRDDLLKMSSPERKAAFARDPELRKLV